MRSTKTSVWIRLLGAAAAVCLVATSLFLVACGGGASPIAANPSEKFLGEWKIAAAQKDGVTAIGDFGNVFNTDDEGGFTVNEDGSVTLTDADQTSKATWTLKSDDVIEITVGSASESTSSSEDATDQKIVLTATYKDDGLYVTSNQTGQDQTIIFTHDGSYTAANQITMDGTTPITSESELVGTWKLAGLGAGGVQLIGDPEGIKSLVGASNATVTFEKDGKVSFFGSSTGTYKVDDKGATCTIDGQEGEFPVVKLGDNIILDANTTDEGLILLSK